MSQNKALLVTTDYIYKNFAGYLDSNIDQNSISTFIWIAQQEQTQQLLGYTLYQKYITLVRNNTINDAANVNYKYLLDNFLTDSISLWTIYYSLDTIHLRVTNKSIVEKHSEFSTAVGLPELYRLKYQLQERSQFADTRVREYILNNPSQFIEYYQVTGVMRMVPKNNTYFGGLYLPDWHSDQWGGIGCWEPGKGFPLFGT